MAFFRFSQEIVQSALQQGILHPLGQTGDGTCAGRWPDNWHKVMSAVRDCGVFPTISPDKAFALTYACTSICPFYKDDRSKWREYVAAYSVGGPCTIKFRHTPNAETPYNAAKGTLWVPPEPPALGSPGGYYRRYQDTDEKNIESYCVEMTLPANCIFVLSEDSRVDWQHAIHPYSPRLSTPGPDHQGPTPSLSSVYSPYPAWNKEKLRRAIIFRTTNADDEAQRNHTRILQDNLERSRAKDMRFEPRDLLFGAGMGASGWTQPPLALAVETPGPANPEAAAERPRYHTAPHQAVPYASGEPRNALSIEEVRKARLARFEK
jgi:hypothetical protein